MRARASSSETANSRLPKTKVDLAAFQFDHGTMMLTEASSNKRAALHVVAATDEAMQALNTLIAAHADLEKPDAVGRYVGQR